MDMFITCNRLVLAAFFCLVGKINFAIVYTPFSWRNKGAMLSVTSGNVMELHGHREATKQSQKLILRRNISIILEL